MANPTTRAQRINARAEKIWAEADRLKTQTRFNAVSRTEQFAEHAASCGGRLCPPVLDNGLWICEDCSFAIDQAEMSPHAKR